MPSPKQQALLQQRDDMLARAAAIRRTDPKMADYLENRAGDMDSELEGVDPIQERDDKGFAQGDDPDYIAFHEAQARIAGKPTGDPDAQSLGVSPTFQAALNQHLGQQMQQNWLQQMQPQGERFQSSGNAPATFNNSVTPSASSMPSPQQQQALIAALKAPTQSPVVAFLQRLAQSSTPDEY